MNQDTINTKRIGHRTGMLSTRSTKGDQCVARDIVAASDRDLFYCVGHILDSDPQKAARHLFGRKFAYLGSELPETLGNQFPVERQIGVWTKDWWKEVRRQASQHYVAIGHGERSASTITRRPRVSSCALRTYSETRPSYRQIEPPPAATVWICIIGAQIRTPATSVSNWRSNSPAKCVTSVEVPPMSNPMIRSKPARAATFAAPTIPPAGPDKIEFFP